MNVRKIFSRGLLVLAVGLFISLPLLEKAYNKSRKQADWTTILSNTSVSTIAFDKQGRAWIGTYEHGVKVLDSETLTEYTAIDPKLKKIVAYSIAFDEQGRAWIGTAEDDVRVFDGKTWKTRAAGHVNVIAIDPQGRAWTGTPGGEVSVFDGETRTTHRLGNRTVLAIAFDGQGRAWIGFSIGGGLSVFDSETCASYTYTEGNSGLIDSSVQTIAFDFPPIWWTES